MSSVVENEKVVCEGVLSLVNKYLDPEAVIAGGAPRNWEEGLPANDIDLYLRSPFREVYHVKRLVTDILGLLEVDFECEAAMNAVVGYPASKGVAIRVVVTFKYKGLLFQFIVCHSEQENGFVQSIIDYIDTGLNRIMFRQMNTSQGYGVDKSAWYIVDTQYKTMTLFLKGMSKEGMQHSLSRHVPKMLKYYPNHRLVVEI